MKTLTPTQVIQFKAEQELITKRVDINHVDRRRPAEDLEQAKRYLMKMGLGV